MNIQHSSRTDKWGTPADIIANVREVLGGIDFDPASDVRFNEVVQATEYYTEKDDALVTTWPTGKRVFLNPPGGKTGRHSNTGLFWRRLMAYRGAGALHSAIFLAFSLEALQTTQSCEESIGMFPFCIPRKRIRFLTSEGLTGPAPSHSNVIVYIPGTHNYTDDFMAVFSDMGLCVRGGW